MPVKNKQSLIPVSFLQSGNDLPITKEISFKHPTIKEILAIDKEHNGLYSEEIYYSMINVFLTDPYQYMVYLDDKGLDYEKITPFQLFIMLYKDRMKQYEKYLDENPETDINSTLKNDIFFRSFKFFLGLDDFLIIPIEINNYIVAYEENKFLFDEIGYEYIYHFVKSINGIKDGERINPDDEFAKQILIEDERERIKKLAKKNADDSDENSNRLGNMLSAVTWACNGGITPFNRIELHMYDIIEGIQRNDKLLNYKNTMGGLYAGTIDKKGIDFKKLHWSL